MWNSPQWLPTLQLRPNRNKVSYTTIRTMKDSHPNKLKHYNFKCKTNSRVLITPLLNLCPEISAEITRVIRREGITIESSGRVSYAFINSKRYLIKHLVLTSNRNITPRE